MIQKSILIVGDKTLILNSLAKALAYEKHEVTMAETGEEAIDQINKHSFDLVITDLLIPGNLGLKVLEATKQRDAQSMVIIRTDYPDLDFAIDALRLGADDFLQKKCGIGELLYRISICFAKQDMQRKVVFYEKILPICCYCKKIRNDRKGAQDQGHWYCLEEYLVKAKGVSVSHGCCPDCFTEQMIKLSLDTCR